MSEHREPTTIDGALAEFEAAQQVDACRSQTAESEPQAGLSRTGEPQAQQVDGKG